MRKGGAPRSGLKSCQMGGFTPFFGMSLTVEDARGFHFDRFKIFTRHDRKSGSTVKRARFGLDSPQA